MGRRRIKAGRGSTYDRSVPFAVIVTLTVILAACALLLESEDGERAAAPLRPDPIERIIDRVER
jgi:hypothetical protein